MAVTWTKEQRQVIELRKRNLLVSAAAGSGKTAVLVERILKLITDKENPVDIDRLLVVTFTKAAAAEMRERVATALERLREENPEDTNLLRQSSLIQNAMITTIDSFCLFVVRNHFEEIGLDPNFRIAEEGEIKLLEADVLDAVFEAQYTGENSESFLHLIDTWAGRNSSRNVKEMVAKIYRMSTASPWPKTWVRQLAAGYRDLDGETPLFMQEVCRYAGRILSDIKGQLERLYELTAQPDGPDKYRPALEADLALLAEAVELKRYEEFWNFFERMKFGNLAPIRNFDGDVQKKEAVQNGRNRIRKELEELKVKYFSQSEEEVACQLRRIGPVAEELIRITLCYMDAMAEEKRRKRLMDFGDMEHFALQILVEEETGKSKRTAEEFRRHFAEIMIDEYQDSNQVQEVILRAISGEEDEVYNMFMVGDVKQSIYRFRLARPELFMEKYSHYDSVEDCPESCRQRIELHRNFRSRKEVLSFTNDVFYKIMSRDLGEVTYDSRAALYPGAEYPPCPGREAEVLLLEEKETLFSDVGGEDKKGIEARIVAGKIKELMETMEISDRETGGLRPLRYSDIVILFRSIKEWGSVFSDVLSEAGIPAHVETSTGYFSAIEVQTVLNMLRILDNPYQDIPMAAVLKSPMVGLCDEEMAEIRLSDTGVPFAAAALAYGKRMWEEMPFPAQPEEGTEDSLEVKMSCFYDMYRKLRKDRDLPIHQLIFRILTDTGYGNYAAALPAGERRAANLAMLQEKAVAYEKTSYKGLFHFVRYIDQLQKYDIDFGEADVTGENADVVHIMTIHKSKGLEFPVVFVSGMSKKFNQMDTNERLVIHPELGMGLDEIRTGPKRRKSCLFRTVIADFIRRENLGEELRVLYVAMTRAKEKLILTGLVSDREKLLERCEGNVLEGQPLSYRERVKASCYTDWIVPALLSYPEKYRVDFVEPEALVWEEIKKQQGLGEDYEEVQRELEKVPRKQLEQIREQFSYVYPYQKDVSRKSKYSVSELKHDSMRAKYEQQEGEAEIPDFLREERESYVPDFARKLSGFFDGQSPLTGQNKEAAFDTGKKPGVGDNSISQGALRGTAMHRVMECLDFVALARLETDTEENVRNFVEREIARMTEKGDLTAQMAALVLPVMVERFVKDPVAKRMAQAAEKGNLYKEKPFVMTHEGVLVQGIIDVFWLEGDEIVLLDYKTDRVERGEELILRYREQLKLYGEALERVFSTEKGQKKAKEKLLYSFRLGEVIQV